MQHNNIINLQPFYNEDTNTLDLSSQGVTDKYVIDYIVPFLYDHPQIRSLNLNNNDIGDVGVKALTDALKGTKITILSLAKNDPEGKKRFMGKTLLQAISSLPTLSEVDISHNGILIDEYHPGCDYDYKISTTEFADLSKKLSSHSQLTKLNMSHNRIRSNKLFKLLTTSIPTLTELNISNNNLSLLDSININDIPTSCSLIKLDISHNWITSTTVLGILASIPTLQELNISHNGEMRDQPTENTKLALSKSHLVKLHIGNTWLKDEAIFMLLTIPTLTDLNLNDTYITPNHIKRVQVSSQFSTLTISNNYFYFQGMHILALAAAFPNLTELDCGNMPLTGISDVDILVKISSLRKLSILTRITPECIVTLLSNPSLEELNIHVNLISPSLAKVIINSNLPPIKKVNFLRYMLQQLLQAEKNGEEGKLHHQVSSANLITPELAITIIKLDFLSIEKINFLRFVIDVSSVDLITPELINEFSNSNLPLHEKTNFLRQIWHKLDAAEKKGEQLNLSKEEKISLEKKASAVPSLLDFTKHDLLQTVPEIKECDLLVIEVENPKKYMASVNLIMKEAKEKNAPVIVFIQSVKKYYIYGDKDNDGHWDFVEISDLSSQDLEPLFDKNKKHWREKTTSPIKLIKRDELYSVLLEQLSKYHFNLELMEKRSYARSNEEIPIVKNCYDKWHSRINKLIRYKFHSVEDVGNFLKLSSNWIDELEKDKKKVAGIPEAILVSKDKKDLLRFLGIVNEQYLSPKRHEAETLQTVLIIHDKAHAYIQKSEETWPRNEIDQLNFHQTKKALNELLINLASFQADEAKLVKLKDKLEPHFYAMTIQPIQTVIKQINDKRDALEGHLSELMKVHSKINEMKDTWVSYLEAIKNENTEGIESNGLRESFRRYLADIDRLKQHRANLQGLKDQVDLLDPSFYAKITPLLEAAAQAIRSKIVEIQKAEAETAKHIVTDWKHRGEVFLAYLKSGPKTEDDHVRFLRVASSLKQQLDKANEIIEHSLCHKAIKDAAIAQLTSAYLYQIKPVISEVKLVLLKTISGMKDGLFAEIQKLAALDRQVQDQTQQLYHFDNTDILQDRVNMDSLNQAIFEDIDTLIQHRSLLTQGIVAKQEELSQLFVQCEGIGLDRAALKLAQKTTREYHAQILALNQAYQSVIHTVTDNKKIAAKIREMQKGHKEIQEGLTQAKNVLRESGLILRSGLPSIHAVIEQSMTPDFFRKGKPVFSYQDKLTCLQQYRQKLQETVDAANNVLLALIAKKDLLEKTNLTFTMNRINFIHDRDLRVNLHTSKATMEAVDGAILDMKNKIQSRIESITVFLKNLNDKLKDTSQKIAQQQKNIASLEKIKVRLMASKPFKALIKHAEKSRKWIQIDAYLENVKSSRTISGLINAVKADPKDVALNKAAWLQDNLKEDRYVHEKTMRENTQWGLYGLFHQGKSTTDQYAIELRDELHKCINQSPFRKTLIGKNKNMSAKSKNKL